MSRFVLMLLHGFGVEHGVDVACPVQDADDLDPAFDGPVEEQVLGKPVDSPDMLSGEAGVGGFPPLAHAWHAGEFIEGGGGRIVETQGRFQTRFPQRYSAWPSMSRSAAGRTLTRGVIGG